MEVEFCESPQGHGYTELYVDGANPFLPLGLRLRGHEFHYSRIVRGREGLATAGVVVRGMGCFSKRDFLVTNNVVATYTHLHALATPEWSEGILKAARNSASRVGLGEATSPAEVARAQ